MLEWRFTSVAVSSDNIIDEMISPNKNNTSGVTKLSKSAIFKHFLVIFAEKIVTIEPKKR